MNAQPQITASDFALSRKAERDMAKLAREKRQRSLDMLMGQEWYDFVSDYNDEYECASGEGETEADRLVDCAVQIADEIVRLYSFIPTRGALVDYAEHALETVTEAMADREASCLVDAAAVSQFFRCHDIDIKEERDNRKARIAATLVSTQDAAA